LFPGTCAVCGCGFTGAVQIRYGLCDECRASITVEADGRCNLCGKPLISEKETCLSCRNGKKRFYDRLWTLFPYAGKYRRLLASYKFEKNAALAVFFAEEVLKVINSDPILKEADIVPVPPRPGKIKESGWDQVECLVKRLEKSSQIKVNRCLKRRKSEVQKRLGRTERLENLKGRVFLNGNAPKAAIVIDDVITTGSTMEVCCAALKEGGSGKVYGLCLFYD